MSLQTQLKLGHKHEDNIIIETYYDNALNEMIHHNNSNIFCSAELKEFVGIVIHSCRFIADQPAERSYVNHAGGNSECSAMFGCRYNIKDSHLKLVYCEKCINLLTLGEDFDQCDDCLNWIF